MSCAFFSISMTSSRSSLPKKSIIKLDIDDLYKISKQFSPDIYNITKDYATIIVKSKEINYLDDAQIKYSYILQDTRDYLSRYKSLIEDYHTYSSLLTELESFALEDNVSLNIIGQSYEGRNIYALKIGKDTGATKPAFLVTALSHAREWTSLEVAYLFIENIIENMERTDVLNLVETIDFWIIPLINPDGFEYSISTDRFWRKNRSPNADGSYGTDLNRNYSYKWDLNTYTDADSDTYKGSSALSENETKALSDFMAEIDIQASVDIHSYGQYVFYPWAYSDALPQDSKAYINLTDSITENIGYVYDTIYQNIQPSSIYPTTNGQLAGSLIDYAYFTYSVPSITIETRPLAGDLSGFELSISEINDTYNELEFLFYSMANIAKNQNFPDYYDTEESAETSGCGE
ncbi:MAG: M14 family metallopeptidase [Pseudomonadota bacterium]